MIARLDKTYYFADSFVENNNLLIYKKMAIASQKTTKK